MDLAVPADHRVKMKEREKNDKYLDLSRELKNLWNIKVKFMPIVTGALITVTEGLLKDFDKWGPSKQLHNIIGQNTENCPGDLRRLVLSQRPSANADVKISKGENNNRQKRELAEE